MSIEILNPTEGEILDGLNNRQIEAVTSLNGANLVIAGAGSGKTAVLTRRVAFLIAKDEIPGRILCLTFTNKAAKEMNDRVRKLLDKVDIRLPFSPVWQTDYLNNPLLCTFHSLGVRLLREFGEKLGLKKDFNILDTDDQKGLIKEILRDLNVDQKNVQPSLISYFISQCKQELLLANDSKKLSKDFLPVFHEAYARYEKKLKDNNSVDFDDLILLPYILLRDNVDVQNTLQDRWHHVMVDEFQDTNEAQFRLIKLLLPEQLLTEDSSRSLFVVGDDAQSIYAFRGSKIEIILNFPNEYSASKEIILNQNYRSTQPILDLAEKILSHNPRQKKKELFTENKENIKVSYYLAKNERDEAEYIIRQLYHELALKTSHEAKSDNSEVEVEFEPGELFEDPSYSVEPIVKPAKDPVSSMFDVYLETEDFAPQTSISSYQPNSWSVPSYNWEKVKELNDCAILYRTHSQSRSLEETFLKYKLPYRLISGVKFLDRKEIKDTLALLKFLSNGDDKISLNRFLPLVLDGVGAKTLEKIQAYLEDFEYPLAPRFQEAVLDLISRLQSCWQKNDNLIDLTKDLIVSSGYLRYLKSKYPIKEEYEARVDNIGELYSLMFPFDEDKTVNLSIRLQRFLEQTSLMSQLDKEDEESIPKINLMSLHQSKGLEFDTVFLVGVEDGLLPHQNSFFEKDGMEEEVRLAYVGVTRAKRRLHLISSDSRIQFGQIKANPVSRIFRPFLDTNCVRER